MGVVLAILFGLLATAIVANALYTSATSRSTFAALDMAEVREVQRRSLWMMLIVGGWFAMAAVVAWHRPWFGLALGIVPFLTTLGLMAAGLVDVITRVSHGRAED